MEIEPLKIRFTKMLGTWIWSGSSWPTGTISSTSAIVILAALHIVALKFRADLLKTVGEQIKNVYDEPSLTKSGQGSWKRCSEEN
jgi:hypothetical protein